MSLLAPPLLSMVLLYSFLFYLSIGFYKKLEKIFALYKILKYKNIIILGYKKSAAFAALCFSIGLSARIRQG